MRAKIDRRSLIAAGLAVPLAALAGCTGMGGGLDFTSAVRRLLTLSSERAFARLLAEDGFYDDQVARITLPPQFGSGANVVVATLLRSQPVRERLLRSLNAAAAEGAERAAPLVVDTIRSMSIADALAVVRGGPTAATALLQREMGDRLLPAMLPEVDGALRLASDPIVGQVLAAATGIDPAALASDVTRRASDGIYAAIGSEESAIRANPRATGDPLLIGVFGLMGG